VAQDFDTIVVGAGSSGCVVAARLSEDPDHRVLILEAGGTDRTALCRVPGMVSIIHTVPQVKKKFDWGFKTVPHDVTHQRKMPYVRGKVLGGSSAINGMVFVRGHRSNYDGWAADGCPGWSFDEVLPYFKKLEAFEGGDSEYRGGSGPVAVTRAGGDLSPVSVAFMDAVASTTGVPVLDDYNAERQEGVGLCQISSKDGVRQSTSEVYLHPHADRPNLTVQSGAWVHRVRFEGTRAVGVDVVIDGELTTYRADRIVLSAGAVSTPHLLLLSGVGPAAHLQEHGVEVVADLPVGHNLHDHLFVPLSFLAPEGGHRGTPWHFFGGMIKERLFGGTWFGRSVFEVMGFIKTESHLPAPDLQLHVLPWAYPSPNQDNDEVRPKVDTRPCITILPTLIYPQSRGRLSLRSADPTDKPVIDPAFLRSQADADHMFRGVQLTREIVRDPAISSMITGELHPGSDYMGDAELRAELPNRVQTVYHPVGTCRMGSDERAVVDPSLRVRGVEGLYVVDASVIPSVPGGNTNAACIMIGEKAADMLRA